jgi:hypothetical protein
MKKGFFSSLLVAFLSLVALHAFAKPATIALPSQKDRQGPGDHEFIFALTAKAGSITKIGKNSYQLQIQLPPKKQVKVFSIAPVVSSRLISFKSVFDAWNSSRNSSMSNLPSAELSSDEFAPKTVIIKKIGMKPGNITILELESLHALKNENLHGITLIVNIESMTRCES